MHGSVDLIKRRNANIADAPHSLKPHRPSLEHWSDRHRLTKPERAVLAAAVLKGAATLPEPGIEQVAALLGVSPTYVRAALHLDSEERADVLLQRRPLIPPPVQFLPVAPTLLESWDRASDAERRTLIAQREQAVLDAV